jgi:hypothetical protein
MLNPRNWRPPLTPRLHGRFYHVTDFYWLSDLQWSPDAMVGETGRDLSYCIAMLSRTSFERPVGCLRARLRHPWRLANP